MQTFTNDLKEGKMQEIIKDPADNIKKEKMITIYEIQERKAKKS